MRQAREAPAANAAGEGVMWNIVKWTGVLLFLFICSVQDIREKKLSVKLLVLSGLLFLLSSLTFEEISWESRMMNMIPGMAAFALAFLTREQMGYGDAACLIVLGSVISGDILWAAVRGGLFFLSLCSIVLLIQKKAGRETTLPFIPFFTAGMLWQMING